MIGPIFEHEDSNLRTFGQHEEFLRKCGHEVVVPQDLEPRAGKCPMPDRDLPVIVHCGHTRECWMRVYVEELLGCDALYSFGHKVGEGSWEGERLTNTAMAMGIPVYFWFRDIPTAEAQQAQAKAEGQAFLVDKDTGVRTFLGTVHNMKFTPITETQAVDELSAELAKLQKKHEEEKAALYEDRQEYADAADRAEQAFGYVCSKWQELLQRETGIDGIVADVQVEMLLALQKENQSWSHDRPEFNSGANWMIERVLGYLRGERL